jgi:hypothetical protein
MRWRPWSRRETCQVELGKPALARPDRVHLGFVDGSEVDLPDSDPTALALRAVADVLVTGAPGVKHAPNRPRTHDGGMTTARRTS